MSSITGMDEHAVLSECERVLVKRQYEGVKTNHDRPMEPLHSNEEAWSRRFWCRLAALTGPLKAGLSPV
jgi:hypothetical protein